MKIDIERSRRVDPAVPTAGLGLLALLAACSSGLGGDAARDAATPPVEVATVPLGIDFGFDPGLALDGTIAADHAIAGAEIPGASAAESRYIAFVAFATDARADDGDGAGTPLVPFSQDFNGDFDVFLMAIEDRTTSIEGGPPQPDAFSRSLFNVFRHSRCVHCHAMGSSNEVGETDVFPQAGGAPKAHPGGDQPLLTDQGCANCHAEPIIGSDVDWRAPRENDTPPKPFDFRGESVHELATRAQSVPFEDHFLNDSRVLWAIESGIVPFQGLAGSSDVWEGLDVDVGPVPISFATFRQQLLAWEAAGFPATASDSTLAVQLVSRRDGMNNAAPLSGASTDPDLTWIPDPGFDPASGGVQRAGVVVVTFVSTATELISNGSSTSDIYRAEFDVMVDLSDGSIAISQAMGMELVSERALGTFGGNAGSFEPSIDASGNFIAFTSGSSNLVSGFVDANGSGTDVFVRDVAGGVTSLVSEDIAQAGGPHSGNGSSGEPDIAPDGGAVVFASDASDLVLGDTNGLRDVFLWDPIGGASIDRVSVASNGAQAVGGGSRRPSIGLIGSARTLAFESEATNLDPSIATTGRQVFLREGGETILLSQRGGEPGNGDSFGVSMGPTGADVLFATAATNLDSEITADTNDAVDVVLVNLNGRRATGQLAARRINTTSLEQESDFEAVAPKVGVFRRAGSEPQPVSVALFSSTGKDVGVTAVPLVLRWVEQADAEFTTDFSASPVVGPAPLMVDFTDQSNGFPSAFAWDFGDGSLSDQRDPQRTYAAPGTYTVSLTVTRDGEDQTETKANFISVLEPLSITGITADPTAALIGVPIQFDPQLAGDEADIVFEWDFGDGSPTSSQRAPNHAFASPGTFDVTLAVQGLAGDDLFVADDIVTITEPTGAAFGFDDSNGLRVQFTDLSVGSPTSIQWDFSFNGSFNVEATSSAGMAITHDYPDTGTRTVAMRAIYQSGTDQVTQSVTVSALRFAPDVLPLFEANCTACHTGPNPTAFDSLTFDTISAGEIYDDLIDVLVSGSGCESLGTFRVRPFDPDESLVVEIANGGSSCASMPAFANARDVATLVLWIQQGAAEF